MDFSSKNFNFDGGRVVNKEIESVLQEVQDVLNLVDVLARTTGQFLNSCGTKEDTRFSENVSHWLFDEKQGLSFAAIKRRERAQRAAIAERNEQRVEPSTSENLSRSDPTNNTPRANYDLDELIRRDEERQRGHPLFSSFRSSSTGHSQASTNFSDTLLSHQVSSQSDYKSPRSRYLEAQAQAVTTMRQRLAALDTSPRSACDLVGPIACPEPVKPTKKSSPGVTVTLGGGSYSSINSCIAKSKSMFGDFASPSNPNYQCPWERSRDGRARLLSNYYR